MRKKDYEIIMGYFNEKKMDRVALETTMNFDNLSMSKEVSEDVLKILKSAGYKKSDAENAIKNFVRYVKSRREKGEITWDEFIEKLKELELEYSEFGIRVQRFSKYSYWEVLFNHFDITNHEDGKSTVTFNQEYYHDTEMEKAYEILENKDIDTELEAGKVIEQVANKWDSLGEDDREAAISALNAIYATQYVDKSRMSINSDMIEKITMTNADLVPEVGLRDYLITFVGGDSISLRF